MGERESREDWGDIWRSERLARVHDIIRRIAQHCCRKWRRVRSCWNIRPQWNVVRSMAAITGGTSSRSWRNRGSPVHHMTARTTNSKVSESSNTDYTPSSRLSRNSRASCTQDGSHWTLFTSPLCSRSFFALCGRHDSRGLLRRNFVISFSSTVVHFPSGYDPLIYFFFFFFFLFFFYSKYRDASL